jgi:hypothetical protein
VAQLRRKQDVLHLMKRVGLGDRVPEARLLLPDPLDLERPEHLELLSQVGLPLDVDALRDQMGGSP